MRIVFFFLSLLILNACSIPSEYSTARITPKEESEDMLLLAISNYNDQEIVFRDSVRTIDNVPSFIYSQRLGLNEKMDLGLKLEMAMLNVTADLRYQYLGDYHSRFAASGSIGIQTENLNSIYLGFTNSFSYKLSNQLEVFVHPKYAFPLRNNAQTNGAYLGFSGGLHFGKENFKVVMGTSQFWDQRKETFKGSKVSQLAIGIRLRNLPRLWDVFR